MTKVDTVAVVRARKRSKSAGRRGPHTSRARYRADRRAEGIRREHVTVGAPRS